MTEDTYTIVQSFSGIITEIREDEFDARMKDLTYQEYPDEFLTFDIEDVSIEDRDLIYVGSQLYYNIAINKQSDKIPQPYIDKIEFRRLPNWTSEEIENAKKYGKEYSEFFRKAKED